MVGSRMRGFGLECTRTFRHTASPGTERSSGGSLRYKHAGHWIARNRRRPLIRRLAGRCQAFLNAYENLNYESKTNGEFRILSALSGLEIASMFDVGAHEGAWALGAVGYHPKAQIHCFELVPEVCDVLRENVKHRRNIIVNCFGLLERDEERLVRYYPEESSFSSAQESFHDLDWEPRRARVTSGDSYVSQHRIDQIGFLKIDVEGAEPLVLQGFTQAFERGIIQIVQFEYGTVSIKTKFLLHDFYEFFDGHGYDVGKIYPTYVDFRPFEPRLEDFRGPNYLAVRRELRHIKEIVS